MQITDRFDPFQHSQKSDIAHKFGVIGVNVSARKPAGVRHYISRWFGSRKAPPAPKGSPQVGTLAPDFTLGTRSGEGRFRLTDERGSYVLLFFVPSEWCPICQVGLRIYREQAPALVERDVKLVVISSFSGPESESFASKFGLRYQVLLDKKSKVARRYGATASYEDSDNDMPLPSSFLIDPEGVVRYASDPKDGAFFADAHEFRRVLNDRSSGGQLQQGVAR